MMKEPAIDFHILNDVKIVDGKTFIEGRNMYSTIRLGQKMNTVSKLSSYIKPDGSADATREFVCAVDVTVVSVWTYGKFVSEISQMMSARLEIAGPGTDKVQRGLALSFIEPETEQPA